MQVQSFKQPIYASPSNLPVRITAQRTPQITRIILLMSRSSSSATKVRWRAWLTCCGILGNPLHYQTVALPLKVP